MVGKKVLVVDDDKGILKLITAILKRNQYDVVAASNGPESLASLESEQPDAVLLDLLMPEMSGFEVLDAIRAHDAQHGKHTLVLFLTAHSKNHGPSPTDHGAEADGWICKPITAAQLTSELDRYMNNHNS